MKLHKFSLDYRSDEKTTDKQLVVINAFMKNKTLRFFTVDDEMLYIFYDDVLPSSPIAFGIERFFDISEVKSPAQKYQEIQLQISSSTLVDAIVVEQVLVYTYTL